MGRRWKITISSATRYFSSCAWLSASSSSSDSPNQYFKAKEALKAASSSSSSSNSNISPAEGQVKRKRAREPKKGSEILKVDPKAGAGEVLVTYDEEVSQIWDCWSVHVFNIPFLNIISTDILLTVSCWTSLTCILVRTSTTECKLSKRVLPTTSSSSGVASELMLATLESTHTNPKRRSKNFLFKKLSDILAD